MTDSTPSTQPTQCKTAPSINPIESPAPPVGLSAGVSGAVPEWVTALDEPDDDELPAGGYVGTITTAYANQTLQRVELTFDIAEGKYTGTFAGCPVNLDWKHRATIPYDSGHRRILKKSVANLANANPSADVYGIYRTDLGGLVGLTVGLILSYREGTDKLYGDATHWPTWHIASLTALRSGSYQVPGLVHINGTRDPATPGKALPKPAAAEDPVPSGSDAAAGRHEPDPIWGTHA